MLQDAWCCPSIVNKRSYNVAFRPERRRERLRLIGVQLGRPQTLSNGERSLHIELLAREKAGTDELDYFRMGSLEHRRIPQSRGRLVGDSETGGYLEVGSTKGLDFSPAEGSVALDGTAECLPAYRASGVVDALGSRPGADRGSEERTGVRGSRERGNV